MSTPDKDVVCRLRELRASKKAKDATEPSQAPSEKASEEGKGKWRWVAGTLK